VYVNSLKKDSWRRKDTIASYRASTNPLNTGRKKRERNPILAKESGAAASQLQKSYFKGTWEDVVGGHQKCGLPEDKGLKVGGATIEACGRLNKAGKEYEEKNERLKGRGILHKKNVRRTKTHTKTQPTKKHPPPKKNYREPCPTKGAQQRKPAGVCQAKRLKMRRTQFEGTTKRK